MWRLTAGLLVLLRPGVAAGLVTIVVVIVGGVTSLPQIVRPAQAAGVPVIQAVPAPVEAASLAVVAPSPSVDCAREACLALTFDDGPSAVHTPRVLDLLDAHDAKATFFVVGQQVPGNEQLLRRMHADGHEIGNHTWGHRKINELSPQELQDDVARTQQVITAAGVPAPRLFRPPYGLFNPMIRSHVQMTVVSWNVDPEDWRARKPEKIVENVVTYAKPGAIIVLHDTEELTADALDPMLATLKQQYRLVTVSELLDLPPGQPGIFYGR